jgi:hypothetical protein
MTSSRAGPFAIALATYYTLAAGADPGEQRRPAAPPGTASIAGLVVTTGLTPQPIRRAIVTLAGGGLADAISAVTTDDGGFRFLNLPPGRYLVSAAKAAFLDTAHGATRPGGLGTPVAVAAGEQVADIRIALARGAVITGVVRDAVGAPAPGIGVSVVRADDVSGVVTWAEPDTAHYTDDQGVYRAYGLAPGEYVIAALPGTSSSNSTARPPEDVDTILRALEARAGAAGFGANALPPSRPAAYTLTYSPAATSFAGATRVLVVPGQVRDGVDVSLQRAPMATLRGTVSRTDGGPIDQIRLSLDTPGPPIAGYFGPTRVGGAAAEDRGAFELHLVPPGRHLLRATASAADGQAAVWAMADLDVGGADIDGIALTLRPSVSVSGRVTFERGAAAAPADPAGMPIGLVPAPRPIDDGSASLAGLLARPASTKVQADGSFVVTGLMPGEYRVAASAEGWWLKTAMLGGRDLLDFPLALGADAADQSGLVLTFSQRRSQLSGVIESAPGQPAPGYFMFVFPIDRAMWRDGARRIRAARSGSDGRYVIPDLPAGDYHLAALTDLDERALAAGALLDQIAPIALRITIADGQQATQNLRIGG